MKIDPDLESKAISNIVVDLENEPVILAEFIIAVRGQAHKNWYLFKQEISKIKSENLYGRYPPIRPYKPKGSHQTLKLLRGNMVFGNLLNRDKCRTKVDEIKLILKADCSNQIKQEFLNGLI